MSTNYTREQKIAFLIEQGRITDATPAQDVEDLLAALSDEEIDATRAAGF